MTASRAGLGSDLMSERSTPCPARKEQMFTTVASGGWGAPPPRPPCGLCLSICDCGVLRYRQVFVKVRRFLPMHTHRKCTNTSFRHRSEDPRWRCLLRASGRAPENPVFGQDGILGKAPENTPDQQNQQKSENPISSYVPARNQ